MFIKKSLIYIKSFQRDHDGKISVGMKFSGKREGVFFKIDVSVFLVEERWRIIDW